MKIASYKRTKEIVDKYDFIFKKNFGQNFLIDDRVLEKIIASSDISNDDVIIEVGPGIGSLTEALSENAFKVIAIEIDSKLIPILKETLKDKENIEIINDDILKINISDIINKFPDKNIKIVANLPYYITTPIVMNLLENRYPIKSITVMVQKEVAFRMKSGPKSKDYGAISLAVQYYSSPYLVANVPQNCFMPRPNVDSAVIRLDVYKNPPVNVINEKLMFKLIKLSFGQRRKTLVNCIFNQGDFNLSKEELENVLIKSGFSKDVRGETFDISDFATLSDCFSKMGIKN